MAFDAVTAYAAARWGPRSRRDLERRQQRLWRTLRAVFPQCPALKVYAEAELADIPVIDAARFRADFDAYNTRSLTLDAATRAAEAAEAGRDGGLPGGFHAGFSTGSGGGQRGLFVTSAAERDAYGGLILGKLVSPVAAMTLQRTALCLRAPAQLYECGRVRFFSLADRDRAAAIAAYNPQVLIAPPQVLLELAASQGLQGLRHLYYGAEPLNAVERDFIQSRLGRRPDPIYQATEGFLGAPCRLGTLHLNEDVLIVEREDAGGGRFRPIVTDLLRRTQLVVRLRLDDLLRPATCACGSPLAAVAPVEGRVQDIWRWGGQTVFPGDVEARIAPLLPPDHGWTATGYAGGIRFACECDADAPGVAEGLAAYGQPVEREAWGRDRDYPKRRHVRWAA